MVQLKSKSSAIIIDTSMSSNCFLVNELYVTWIKSEITGGYNSWNLHAMNMAVMPIN